MAKIISIINIKGGVGKSTITLNLADALHRYNRKVLMIDLDMQSNLTDMGAGNLDKITVTTFELFVTDDRFASGCTYPSIIPGCDIIPADLRLSTIEREIDPGTHPNALMILSEKIDIEARNNYDYIIIDCRPDMDLISMNALMASDFYIIPVKPDRHSIKGIQLTDMYIQRVQRANKKLKEIGILVNDHDARTNIAKIITEALEKRFPQRLMSTIIKTNTGIATAAAKRKTVFQFDKQQSGCESFRSLAHEVMAKVGDMDGAER